MGEPTTLYRMRDEVGVLLYVGVTATVRGATRFGEHAKHKWWWPDVQSITVEHYMTREAAESAEQRAIQTEGPLHNIVHNQPSCRTERSVPPADGLLAELRSSMKASTEALVPLVRLQVVELLVGLGRADEPCIECGALTPPYSWDLSGLVAVYRCRCDPTDPCSTWWEQPRALPEVEGVYDFDEWVLLRDQLKAKAEHGAPLIAPEVEPVLAGLAARWPRVD